MFLSDNHITHRGAHQVALAVSQQQTIRSVTLYNNPIAEETERAQIKALCGERVSVYNPAL